MPHRVNGCGTWYIGSKNVQLYQGQCRACGRFTSLKSYDTQLFVTILFVPLIPLSKKRIIEQCGACKRHLVVSLNDYQRSQNRLRETAAAFRKAPSAESAREALQACVSFRNLTEFLSIAPEIERSMGHDAKTLCLVATAYNLFGRSADCERVVRQALAVSDEASTREMLAEVLLRQGKASEAEPYLQHVIDKQIPDRVGQLFHLAQAFQNQGDHDRALKVFDACEVVNPLIAKDENYVRLREASEKLQGTKKVVALGSVLGKAKARKNRRRLAKVAIGVLAVAAIAYIAACVIMGLTRDVYLANGLERPYAVKINDQNYLLNAHSIMRVRTGERNVKVEVVNPLAPIPAEIVSVQSPFWSRPFAKNVFVINPDGTAIVERAVVHYSSGGAIAPTETFSGGTTLLHFDDVDYPFETPPSSIQMDSNSGFVSKVELKLLNGQNDLNPSNLLELMKDKLGTAAVTRMAQRHIDFEPDDEKFYGVFWALSGPDAVATFLRPLVSIQPVQIEWHRMYQSAMSAIGKDEEVEREYTALLSKQPQDKQMMYLASRAMLDQDASVELCKRSIAEPNPYPYGFYSMCGYCLESGQFHEAADYGRRAFQLLQNHSEVELYFTQCLLADGQYDSLLEHLRTTENRPWPAPLAAFVGELNACAASGQLAAANEAINRLRLAMKRFDPNDANKLMTEERADLEYCFGQPDAWVRFMGASARPEERLVACLCRADVAGCEKEISSMHPDADTHGLIYLVAKAAHSDSIADQHRLAMIELLAKGDYEDRALAAAIRGTSTMRPEQIIRLRGTPEQKRIRLAVLGTNDPSNRELYFALGSKLNFDRQFPYLLLKNVYSQH